MIATASLTIPSPNTIENSLGFSSYLMRQIAAITSEEHNRDDKSIIGSMPNLSWDTSFVDPLNYVINSPCIKPYVRIVNIPKQAKDPITPKSTMYPKF